MCVWLVYERVILRGIKRFDLVVPSLASCDGFSKEERRSITKMRILIRRLCIASWRTAKRMRLRISEGRY